jgi:endonuclease/exonuclease/phosphatase family metal-dependent hydrolase
MKRRLRVVTWNVGRVYSPTHNNRLDDDDVPRVAATLHELDPDVALLQEVVDEVQLRAICVRAGGYEGRLAERCEYDRHCAVLVRRELQPSFEQHRLAARGLVLAAFEISGTRAAAASLHFDVFARRRRRAQAEALAALADARGEDLLVVGGDLNIDPEWARRLDDPVDAGTWQLLTSRFADAGHAAGPTLLGLLRLDHVLARGRAMRGTVARVSPRRRLPLGDHDPVVCDVDLPRRAVDGDGRNP